MLPRVFDTDQHNKLTTNTREKAVWLFYCVYKNDLPKVDPKTIIIPDLALLQSYFLRKLSHVCERTKNKY